MSSKQIDKRLTEEAHAAFYKKEDMSKRETGPELKTPYRKGGSSARVEEDISKFGAELFGADALDERLKSGEWIQKLSILLLLLGMLLFTLKPSIMENIRSFTYSKIDFSNIELPEPVGSGKPKIDVLTNTFLLDVSLSLPYYVKLSPKRKNLDISHIPNPAEINSKVIPDNVRIHKDMSAGDINNKMDIGFSDRILSYINKCVDSNDFKERMINRERLDLIDSLINTCRSKWDNFKYYDLRQGNWFVFENSKHPASSNKETLNDLDLIIDIDLIEYSESSHTGNRGGIKNSACIKYILRGVNPITREVTFAEPIESTVILDQPAGFDTELINTPLYKSSPAMLMAKKQVIEQSENYLSQYFGRP